MENNSHNRSGPGVLADLQRKLTSGVDNEKNRAAENISSLADVIRKTGEELRPQNEILSTLLDGAGDHIRRFADGIRQRGAGELVRDVADFGRRQPVMFVGSAFLVGLGVVRFLKASSVEEGSPYGERFATDPMTSSSLPSSLLSGGGVS